jgi:beta-lactamase regulating signal transducer with metallopeptidase domain/protocatechuate 3,4-dioxygenase beta subunit/peroxiredoxin
MNQSIVFLNAAGKGFVNIALPMLIQSSVLIVAMLVLDLLLRRRVKAVVRYGIWLLVLVKLVLPPSLAAPTSLVYWIGARLPSFPSQVETVIPEPPAAPLTVSMTEQPIARAEPRFAPPVEYEAPAFDPPSRAATAAPEPVVFVSPPPPITWQAMVFLAWLVVVVVMTLLLIQRAFFVRGLVAQSKQAPKAMGSLLERCRQQMGVGRAVGLRLTSLSASPSVCGLGKPRILMPQCMIAQLDAQQMKSILLHELAHVKRGDLWVNLVQALLQIAYFFHPLLWLANLMIRRVREQAVDETVLATMGDEAEDYPRTLLNVSKLAFGRPALSLRLIGVVESKKALTARIRHIVTRPFPKTAKLGLTGLVLVATVAAVLLPMAKAEKKEDLPQFTEAEISAGLASLKIDPNKRRTLRVPYVWEGLDLDSESTVPTRSSRPTGVDLDFSAELRKGKRIKDFVAVSLGDGKIDDVQGRRILTLKSDEVGAAAAELLARAEEFRSSKAGMNGFYTDDLPTFFAVLSDGIVPAAATGNSARARRKLWLIRMTKARAKDVEIEYWQGVPPRDEPAEVEPDPALEATARTITGQVVDPNGAPVHGAQVALCTEYTSITVLTPKLLPTEYAGMTSAIVETDAEGRFSFSKMPADFAIIASHETGFARVDGDGFTASTPIQLERWGQIEGTLYVGHKPARDEVLTLAFGTQKRYAGLSHYEHRAETKAGGRFIFRRVVPGWLTIGSENSTNRMAEVSVSRRPIHLKPGETMEITLGNTGRPLVGTFVLPPDSNHPADATWSFCRLLTVRPQAPEPVGFDELTGAEKAQWHRQWGKTPEGRAYFEAAYHDPDNRTYSFQPDDNSGFRIDNVIPGRYRFMVRLQNAPARSRPFPKPIGHYFATIEVPPMAEAYSDEPLDLGTVTLTTDSRTDASSNGPTDEIAGVVVDPSGQPIMDARVDIKNKALLLLPESEQRRYPGRPVIQQPSMQTDGQGRFRFTELRPGSTDLTVWAMGCRTETLHDISPGTTGLRVQLGKPQPPTPYTLSGIVQDEEGNPVSDAEVFLIKERRSVRENWTGTSSSVHTGTDGTFQFPGPLDPVPDGSSHREVFVRKEGYGLWGKLHFSKGTETFIQVTLRPQETVSGRVIDEEGKPIPSAMVAMESWTNRDEMRRGSLHDWMPFVRRTQAESDGTFTLTGLPTDSTVNLGVTAEGYDLPQWQGIQTGEFGTYAIQTEDGGIITYGSNQESGTPVEFILQRAVTLRGTVVYEDTNEPAADIWVGAQGWKYVSQWKTGTHADRRFDPRASLTWSETRTDANGRFEMTDVRPIACDLVVVPDVSSWEAIPEWVAQAITFEDLEPGETREDLRLVLTKGGIVRGRVVDAEGNPLQGINVRLDSTAHILLDGAGAFVETKEDGTWAYRFPPGEVRAFMTMRREGWGWQPEDRTVTLSIGQTIDSVNFQLTCALPPKSPHRAKPVQARSDFVQTDTVAKSSTTRKIQGIVTDTLGRPRECVYVAPQGTRVWDGVMSDAQGRFVLEDITPAQTTWIAWSQASRLYGFFTRPQGTSAQPVRATLNLDEADLSGRIVGADGKGLTECEVEVIVTTADGIRFPLTHRPKTDAFGYYSHSSVPCGAGISFEATVLNSDAATEPHRTGPVKGRAGQTFIEMPLLVGAEKKIQPDFDRNLRNDGMLHCRGRVVDENGKPIAGVRVHMSFDMTGWMSTWVRDAMTDSEGRWHRAVPPQCMDLSLEFEHAEFYIEDNRITPSRDELEKGTHRVTMKRGLILRGKVVNEQGRPVENALVCADRSYGRTPSPYNQIMENSTTARTLKNGTFRIGGLPPGTRTIAAYSNDYAPALQAVDIQADMSDIKVVLAQGRTYRGRVVDATGQPMEDVRIGVTRWQMGKERRDMSRLARTDAQGNFALTNLPEGQITLYFGKKPLMGFRKDLPEDLSQVDEAVMYEVPVFTGRVVDSETGEPIPEFSIANGVKWNRQDASFDWSRYHRGGTKDVNGVFTHRWGGYAISYPASHVACIKIQAPGYLPTVAPPLELGVECEPLTIRLRRGTPITGTVRTPDGSAASEAQIALVRAGEQAYIDRYQFSADSFSYQAEIIEKADESGAFELPPTEEQGLLVAVHESGYAQIPSDEFVNGSDLTLTAWSRVEGTIDRTRIEGEDLEIALYPLDRNTGRNVPSITWLFDRISPTGHTFALEYLPAVPLAVGRITRYEMNDGTHLIPQPGKTDRVFIGLRGQTVTGRINCPPQLLKDKSISLADPRQTHAVAFRVGEDATIPSNVTTFDESSFTWLWRDKEHVYTPSQTVRKRFVPHIAEDGQFTFTGLAPGQYEFVVNIHAPLGENVSCGRGVFEGVAMARFTVPQGQSDSPLRAPDIQVQQLTYPGAGEPAPLFVEQTFGGRTVRLEDLRGKVVLLDFWASWCSPCVAQLPKIQALHKAFADREDFAIIGLSLDWDIERAKRMIDEKQLGWTQIRLGSMDESIMVKQYGVGEIPMTILIGADGTILARGTDVKELNPMIEKALAKTR